MLIPAEASGGALTSKRVLAWARGFSSSDPLDWMHRHDGSFIITASDRPTVKPSLPAAPILTPDSCTSAPRSFQLIPQHPGPPELRGYPARLLLLTDSQLTLTSSGQVGSFTCRKRRRTVAGFVVKQAFIIWFYSQSCLVGVNQPLPPRVPLTLYVINKSL